MAMSNRDRVGKGFEILTEGLKPFVDTRMSAATPGKDWFEVWQRREEAKSGAGRTFSKDDPRLLLRILTEEWRVFKDQLSRAESSLASELRDTGNRWAHHETFSFDDAHRALDTTERLLTAVGAAEHAERVRKIRLDLQRASYEAETKRNAKAAETPVSAPGTLDGHGLKPWREVLTPHHDIATGNYASAEFAADLHRVAFGTGDSAASPEYADPVLFFQRTYLTDGLKDLLSWAVRRLGGDTNAPPIVNLQTNFGGGKTHSMLSLWHLFSGRPAMEYPQEFQELFAGRKLEELGERVRRVALVGTHIPAGEARTMADGTTVHTLWGELAWQLGGREAYDIVADADRTRSNPASALNDLIQAYAPCLILVDEWVAYARQLYDRDDLPGGSFPTQFTFAQTLTEVVSGIPGAMLVVSIPASHDGEGQEDTANELETGGTNGRAALAQLQNVIRRKADQWRPASSHESFEIVRRRLFEEPDSVARSAINATARAYVQFYARNRQEFPTGCAELAYEERIRATYPIHPELFQRLYDDWSALDRFQRTRGVLRLMSVVIHELWRDEDPAPLIMPGSIPLDAHRVRTEISQYLEDNFKPVIDADIDGTDSTPSRIDAERPLYQQRRLVTRLARTIFFGSAPTLKSSNKGIDQQRIWLGMAIPGDTVGNFGGALHLLSDRAHYLYSDNSRYWYNTQPSVTRMARDHAERLRENREDVWAHLDDRLRPERGKRGDFAAVHVAVETTNEVSDTDEARLVILHPRYAHTRRDDTSPARRFAAEVLQRHGSAQRANRNMVVFLAPDEKRLADLEEATRDSMAWEDIVNRVNELELSPQQASHARGKLDAAKKAVAARIPQTYFWVFAPMQRAGKPLQWEELKADRGSDSLAERVTEKLRANAQLLPEISAAGIRRDLDGKLGAEAAWGKGYLTFGELWGYCCKYAYLPRLTNRRVLERAIHTCFDRGVTWEKEGFALAEGYDEASGRFHGLLLPMEDPCPAHITDAMLLVRPDLALAQREREREKAEHAATQGSGSTTVTAGAGEASGTGEIPGTGGGIAPAATPPRPTNVRFYGTYTVDPSRYARDFGLLSQEVLGHLTMVEGAKVEIRVDITATREEGFDEDTVRVVSENAATLKFDDSGFSDSE